MNRTDYVVCFSKIDAAWEFATQGLCWTIKLKPIAFAVVPFCVSPKLITVTENGALVARNQTNRKLCDKHIEFHAIPTATPFCLEPPTTLKKGPQNMSQLSAALWRLTNDRICNRASIQFADLWMKKLIDFVPDFFKSKYFCTVPVLKWKVILSIAIIDNSETGWTEALLLPANNLWQGTKNVILYVSLPDANGVELIRNWYRFSVKIKGWNCASKASEILQAICWSSTRALTFDLSHSDLK